MVSSMKNILLLIFLLPLIALSQGQPTSLSVDSVLNVLEQEITKKSMYEQQKLTSIAPHLHTLTVSTDPQTRYNACLLIVDGYKSFVYDSAFLYSVKLTGLAFETERTELIQLARMKTAFTLVSGGMLKEANDTLLLVDPEALPDTLLHEYYAVATRLNDFHAFYAQDAYYAKIYERRSLGFLKKELILYPDSSEQAYFLLVRLYTSLGDHQRTEKLYFDMLRKYQLTDHHMAMKSYDVGASFEGVDPSKAIYYKAVSAIYDIKAAVKENVAIRELAEELYQQGDLRRSSLFIKQALEDANFYSSRLRKVEVSDILPIIEGRQYQELESQNSRVVAYSYIITGLVVILGLFLFIIFRQLKKLRLSQRNLDTANATLFNTNLKLEESNKIKEAYIGQFFNVISEHLFKTEKLVTSINRKLSQRRFDDLSEITDNINSFKERELLYKNFDDMFLDLFPDFIQKLNGLLKPGEQLDTQMKLLTPEIRIYALLRLGIADNNQIARFLNYSINTIYTYKTRLKSKAVDPDTFEESVIEM